MTDPLCLITAPANDPTIITVGSANTRQSDGRADDSVNYFSSRGPTLSGDLPSGSRLGAQSP